MTTVGRWLPAWIGAGLLALIVVFALTDPGGLVVALFKAGMALVLSVGLIGLGYWTLTSDGAVEEYDLTVVKWTLAGIVAMTVLNVWFRFITSLYGPIEWQVATLSTLAAGGFGGALVGLYSARNQQQQAERRRALSDYEEMFTKADVGIALNDPEAGTVGQVNPRYAEMLGYDAEELEDMPISAVSADDPRFDEAHAMELVEQAMAGEPQQFDWLFKRKDGRTLWGEVSIKRATIGGQDRLLAFVRDISERREKEETLSHYREIFQKADVGIALLDPETGTFERVNQRYAEQMGYEIDDLEGMAVPAVSADEAGFDEDRAREHIERAVAGDSQQFDWLHERSDGTTFWAEVSLKRAQIGDEQRLVAFVRDVTERRAHEQELERHRDEMEFFNSLLRHDVLNAVMVIRTHGSRLADDLEGEQQEHAETIVEWADNVTDVIGRVQDVLDRLTGEQDQPLEPVDLSTVLRERCEQIDGAYPEVTVETAIPDGVYVDADDLLGDVFWNVLTNAVDHNETEGLELTATVDPQPDTVTVTIADNGKGIPDEDKEAVFRREETGHVKKTGSGFGLFFVDSMLEAYGGEVWIEDNDPSGTAVVFELPASSTDYES